MEKEDFFGGREAAVAVEDGGDLDAVTGNDGGGDKESDEGDEVFLGDVESSVAILWLSRRLVFEMLNQLAA